MHACLSEVGIELAQLKCKGLALVLCSFCTENPTDPLWFHIGPTFGDAVQQQRVINSPVEDSTGS